MAKELNMWEYYKVLYGPACINYTNGVHVHIGGLLRRVFADRTRKRSASLSRDAGFNIQRDETARLRNGIARHLVIR